MFSTIINFSCWWGQWGSLMHYLLTATRFLSVWSLHELLISSHSTQMCSQTRRHYLATRTHNLVHWIVTVVTRTTSGIEGMPLYYNNVTHNLLWRILMGAAEKFCKLFFVLILCLLFKTTIINITIITMTPTTNNSFW